MKPLKNQLTHAIAMQNRMGQSKHNATAADRATGVYSVTRCTQLNDTGAQFARWMRNVHPDTRMVRDITTEHVGEWLQSLDVADTTRAEYAGRMGKLYAICNATYNGMTAKAWSVGNHTVGTVRKVAMSRADYNNLLGSLATTNQSDAHIALELSARCGLRLDECCHVRARDINITTQMLYVQREGASHDHPHSGWS